MIATVQVVYSWSCGRVVDTLEEPQDRFPKSSVGPVLVGGLLCNMNYVLESCVWPRFGHATKNDPYFATQITLAQALLVVSSRYHHYSEEWQVVGPFLPLELNRESATGLWRDGGDKVGL